MQFNLFHFAHKRACILVCFKLVVNCPGELVAKCLCKLASFIKSIWHLVSPSYDSKVSIYTLNYWCTWLATLAMSLWAWFRQCFVTLLREALRTYARNVCKAFCAVYHSWPWANQQHVEQSRNIECTIIGAICYYYRGLYTVPFWWCKS